MGENRGEKTSVDRKKKSEELKTEWGLPKEKHVRKACSRSDGRDCYLRFVTCFAYDSRNRLADNYAQSSRIT